MNYVQLTDEQKRDMLQAVERVEEILRVSSRAMRQKYKGVPGYEEALRSIKRDRQKTKRMRAQIEHLSSGIATEDDKIACIKMLMEWTGEARQSKQEAIIQRCKLQMGEELAVILPTGEKVLAWHFWCAQSTAAGAFEGHLEKEVARIEKIYQQHSPRLSATERTRRAFCIAMKLVDIEVTPWDADADDLAVLMLTNGLEETDFEVRNTEDGPIVRLSVDAMRRVGMPPNQSRTLN